MFMMDSYLIFYDGFTINIYDGFVYIYYLDITLLPIFLGFKILNHLLIKTDKI